MGNANLYTLDVAIDSYLAKNGQEDQIDLWGDSVSGYEYGGEKFRSREQAINWLKNQNVNHEAITNYIDEVRANGARPQIESIFQTYEKYYGLTTDVQKDTKKNLTEIKDNNTASKSKKRISTPKPKPSPVSNSEYPIYNSRVPKKSVSTSTSTSNDLPEHVDQNLIDSASKYNQAELSKIGKTVSDLQIALKEKGDFRGKITGQFDEETYISLRLFKSGIPNIKTDGYLDSITISKLFETKSNNYTQNITETNKTKPNNEKEFKKSIKNVKDEEKVSDYKKNIDTTNLTEKTDKKSNTKINNTDKDTEVMNNESSRDKVSEQKSQLDLKKNYAEIQLEKNGKTVTELQQELKKLGLYKDEPDGIFGGNTLKAVEDFQIKAFEEADGYVGIKTINALFDKTEDSDNVDTTNHSEKSNITESNDTLNQENNETGTDGGDDAENTQENLRVPTDDDIEMVIIEEEGTY